ncbi:SUKH-3 domain-containing protein [Microtetraspora fusca]|uniref:SUKH-3 domain-containing protein n=1 Tax=Microtetraspora fusca TaxID=1997 RepID=A0ABW6V386_MICFU
MHPEVRHALVEAGWRPGRRVDPSLWISPLRQEGFQINERARAILCEYGGLKVERQGKGVSDNFDFDPFDAASGLADEAEMLTMDYGEVYTPIGMWSGQYVSYVGECGRVVAVGPGWDWKLGDSLEEALELVVLGNREIECIKTRVAGAAPFPAPKPGSTT